MEAKITKRGRELLCKAHAGIIQLSPIAHIALGSGGCFEDAPVSVTGNETALKQELIRKEVESRQYEEEADGDMVRVKTKYSMTLSKDELAGETISEAGLIDGDDNLVAYLTFLGKGKDQDMEFTFNLEEIF